jgi:hypothetical protein
MKEFLFAGLSRIVFAGRLVHPFPFPVTLLIYWKPAYSIPWGG